MLKKIYRFLSPKFQTLFLDYPVEMKPRYGHGLPPHGELYQIVNQGRESYKDLIQSMLELAPKIQEIKPNGKETDVSKPVWNNGFLPGLDIAGIYTMLVQHKPKRYVEVGSGNSTKVAYKAKHDFGLAMEIISIDPMPRAEMDALADQIIRKPFEDVSLEIIHQLEENDVLFIDNSHRILPNSDAMVFFMEVLPRLKKGVLVQIHDIYIPYDYPQFMCDRNYTEQYGLMAYILANPARFVPVLPNYFISEDTELAEMLSPLWKHENLQQVEKHGGSFWLQIR